MYTTDKNDERYVLTGCEQHVVMRIHVLDIEHFSISKKMLQVMHLFPGCPGRSGSTAGFGVCGMWVCVAIGSDVELHLGI